MKIRASLIVFIPVALLLSAPVGGEMRQDETEITDTSLNGLETQNWHGNWETTYGQLRLMQEGDRVYGDYHVRGVIEGRVSEDGKVLRGIFTYSTGRWGTFVFRKNRKQFQGSWRWHGIAQPGDENWQGQKTASVPSPLYQANCQNSLVNSEIPGFQVDEYGTGETAARLTLAQTNISTGERDAVERFLRFQEDDWLESDTLANQADSHGPWQGTYQLEKLVNGVEMTVLVNQVGDTQNALAKIQLRVDADGRNQCLENLHPGFCREMNDLAQRGAKKRAGQSAQGRVQELIVDGVKVTMGYPRSMMIAFRMAGGHSRRILRLVRDERNIRAEILHASRGVDYTGTVVPGAHLCGWKPCEREGDSLNDRETFPNVPDAIEGDPGIFADPQFLAQFKPRVDNRLRAQRQVRIAGSPTHGPHAHRMNNMIIVSARNSNW